MTVNPNVLRTPDERFSNLPAFPYSPHYIDDLEGYEGLRIARIDEGPEDAEEVFLCLHGEPTWSYLYRKMIPIFAATGARVVCPDLIGFGRSDKPIDDAEYTFNFHRDYLLPLIERLDLKRITLVCQDWGGLLGLTLPMEMPERFSRLIVMNTAIPIGQPISPGFDAWKAFSTTYHDLPVSGLIALSSPGALSPYDAYAYDAPFPDASYKAGVRRFPALVPIEPGMQGQEHGERARAFFQNDWQGETFMAVGMRDPVLGPPVMKELRGIIKGCPAPLEIAEGGHFVQEWGDQIAPAALKAFELTR